MNADCVCHTSWLHLSVKGSALLGLLTMLRSKYLPPTTPLLFLHVAAC